MVCFIKNIPNESALLMKFFVKNHLNMTKCVSVHREIKKALGL